MIDHPHLTHIGQVAVFYVPHEKCLNRFHYDGKSVGDYIHDFLIEHYDAYTVEKGNAHGYWRKNKEDKLYHDTSARYEVSFGGPEKIQGFIDFLVEICCCMGEEAIYLTMGRHSYFVTPKSSSTS